MFSRKASNADAQCVYTAVPVQVVDEGNASLETLSNPSLQSQLTTSDDSDTVRVYDFNKQETRVVNREFVTDQPSTSSTLSMESALGEANTSSSSSTQTQWMHHGNVSVPLCCSLDPPTRCPRSVRHPRRRQLVARRRLPLGSCNRNVV